MQFGKTALIMAAECNNIDCLRALFDSNPASKPGIDHKSKASSRSSSARESSLTHCHPHMS